MIQKGTIQGGSFSGMSGLAFLFIENEDGFVNSIPCDNGPLARALDGAFGVITAHHSVDMTNAIGREVYYSMDDFGLCLGWFLPVEDASAEIIEAYENGEDEEDDEEETL